MEKLSERIDTLKPRTSEKLKADLVDIAIYLVTLVPIINILVPLYNTEDYNFFRAVILGSLIFIVANYFLRYYLPLKLKGRTIGKLLFHTQTVDYYGYEVKPGQLLFKEFIYIFVPVLVFSKFTYLNYGLLAIWFIVFLMSAYQVYLLTKKSMKEKLEEAKEHALDQELDLEEVGYYLFDKLKERKDQYKLELKDIKNKEKEAQKALKNEHKTYLSTLQDKEAIYQAKVKQKLEFEKLLQTQKEARQAFDKLYDQDVLDIQHKELEKAENIIEDNKEPEPNYYPISEFVLLFPNFLEEFFEVDHTLEFEAEVDEDGNKILKTPYDALIEKYRIDVLPKQLLNIKKGGVVEMKLHRTIESGNTFIIDIECRYERIKSRVDKETKEKFEVVTPVFRTISMKVLMFEENESPTINFLEPKLYGKAKKRAKLHQKAKEVQSRSIMDLRANTVTVDYHKFQEFFETHRTEE